MGERLLCQLGERLLCKQEVIGSNPCTSTTGKARLRPNQAVAPRGATGKTAWCRGDVRRRLHDSAAGDRGGALIDG